MRFFDIIRFAIRNFFRRKARSLLTILGVVIGTMSVVIMLSISEALDVGSVKQIEQWGSLTEINVYPMWGDDNAPKLTDDLVARINSMENVVATLPIRTKYVRLTKGRLEAWAPVVSVDITALPHFGQELEFGRFVEQDGSYEVLMGYEVPFGFQRPGRWDYNPAVDYDWENQSYTVNPLPFDPTEETNIRLMPNVYTEPDQPKPKNFRINVVGVLKWGMNNWQFNNGIIMDTAAFDKLEKELTRAEGGNNSGGRGGGMVVMSMSSASPARSSSGTFVSSGRDKEEDKYENLTIKVNDMNNVMDIQKELQDWGLQAWSNMDSLEYAKEQFAFIQMILGGIGLVAFLVAALGIANTMIMSTYERTREIGVMKVLGCRLGNILSMFLCESAIIGLFGGALGVGLSFAASYVLNTFVDASLFGFSTFGGATYDLSIIPIWLVGAGLVFTTLVGIVSGLYPSIRAMRLSALEAIKNE